MCSGWPGWHSFRTAPPDSVYRNGCCCSKTDRYLRWRKQLLRTMITNRFTGHRGYRVIQQISGVGHTFAAIFIHRDW
jgi:hypothetical protein